MHAASLAGSHAGHSGAWRGTPRQPVTGQDKTHHSSRLKRLIHMPQLKVLGRIEWISLFYLALRCLWGGVSFKAELIRPLRECGMCV
jgi:hypothetical protein